ncbi:MAG TPA: hypothetical protein VGQ69_16370 [Gemmatimonadales bacterium]|nr:hypothetical protein [Gemmatimonadales bacterium]
MSRIGFSVACFAGLLVVPSARGQSVPTFSFDSTLARQYLREAAELTARDSGRLWGRSLAGSLLFVHPASRLLLADTPDAAGQLRPFGALYTGRLPESEPVANTGLRWGGRSWAMLIWPLPADSLARAVLVAHELWHRIQDSLGLPARDPPSPHLAGRDGRLWLRLEGRALRRAIEGGLPARERALRDALLFRAYRQKLSPGADSTERLLELSEGLAEYTGVTLAASTPELRRGLVLRRLATLDSVAHFERDFAYHTGPAYGLLLDELAPDWRRGLGPGADLAALLAQALRTQLGARASTARSRASGYGYAALLREENTRRARRLAHLAALRTRFVTGSLLELPLGQLKLGFDPGAVESLDSLGTVYGSLRLSDRWGVLQTDASGGLISPDWLRLVVPAPADTGGRRLAGPGWTLELAAGWRLIPGRRPGDWTVQPQSP